MGERVRLLALGLGPTLVSLIIIAAIYVCTSSCAAGPQVPVTTPVNSIHVNITACDGGTIRIGQFWIDGLATAKPRTTGIQTGDIAVDTEIDTDVEEGSSEEAE